MKTSKFRQYREIRNYGLLIWQDDRPVLECASPWAFHSRRELARCGACASGKSLKTNPKGVNTECVFTDGTSILVSNFLASFIRAGDELLFPLGHEAAAAGTQIYIRKNPS